MKTLLIRPLITLTVAASVAFLAGCLEQTRRAGPPVTTVPGPVAPPPGEPEIVSRPDPAHANISGPVAEVARLHLSGLDETVIKAFVERSTNPISPTADELIYLRDIGVSPRVITVMIQQTARMREQGPAASPAPAAAATTPAPPGNSASNAPAATVAAPPAATAPNPAAAPPVVVPAPPAPALVAAPAPPGAPPEVATFYQELQPYGTWMQVADYGWCWQPSVVVSTPSWRPYADRGRWLYTDQGWYWQSDYAWGWAPFHYGRWVNHARSGWLWIPDTTWGPAWVVWRSSDAYCGWAPLPPSAVFVAGRGLYHRGAHVALDFDFGLASFCYTFVPFSRFCDRNPHYYAVTPTVAVNVYNQTTVINNIRVNNNVIVNGGVNVDRVATLTRSEIRKVAVRDAAPGHQGLQRLDKLEKTGDDLVIYRPTLNPNAPVKPMKLTNEKGESRVELVPAGTLSGQKITGRPVYDTTSTGARVLTGYTSEPPARPAGQNTVVINNNITTAAPPAPDNSATTPSNTSTANEKKEPERAGRIFGVTPSSSIGRRNEERQTAPPAASVPSSTDNLLFRPLTPPQPVTSTPKALTPPQPVVSSPPPSPAPAPSRPVATYQPPSRSEAPKPEAAKPSTAPAPSSYSPPRTTVPPAAPAPYAPATRSPVASTPSPAYSAPAPTYTAPAAPMRPAPSAPAYTPAPSRPAYSAPAPAPAPAPSRPTVYVSPPPQPSSAPASAPSNNSSPSRNDQEKKK